MSPLGLILQNGQTIVEENIPVDNMGQLQRHYPSKPAFWMIYGTILALFQCLQYRYNIVVSRLLHTPPMQIPNNLQGHSQIECILIIQYWDNKWIRPLPLSILFAVANIFNWITNWNWKTVMAMEFTCWSYKSCKSKRMLQVQAWSLRWLQLYSKTI